MAKTFFLAPKPRQTRRTISSGVSVKAEVPPFPSTCLVNLPTATFSRKRNVWKLVMMILERVSCSRRISGTTERVFFDDKIRQYRYWVQAHPDSTVTVEENRGRLRLLVTAHVLSIYACLFERVFLLRRLDAPQGEPDPP